MGVVVVVVGEPPVELAEHRDGVRQRVDANVVAFERPDQGLREAVALRAGDRGEARLQTQSTGKVAGILGRVGAAMVAQPLDGMRRHEAAEAGFDRRQHQVADRLTIDPGAGHTMPADHLAVVGVDHKRDPDALAVPAGDLEDVGAPAQVRMHHDDPAIVDPARALVASIEQVAAQIPAGPGLDGDAGVPAAQIGEPVSPAKAKAKKAEPAAPQAGVTLTREPGRGWFHIEIDGVRVGIVFQTTQKGVKLWAASARPMGRDVRTEGANRQAALDAFIKRYRAS